MSSSDLARRARAYDVPTTETNPVNRSSGAILEEAFPQLEMLVTQYLMNDAIYAHLLEAVAKAIFGRTVDIESLSESAGQTPQEIIELALKSFINVKSNIFTSAEPQITVTISLIVRGAPGFELIVRYLRTLNPAIVPSELIPSDEVVEAALDLFHKSKRLVVDVEGTFTE